MIAFTSFNIVGTLGKASFPVSRTLPVAGGRLAFNVDGGDVDVSGGGTGRRRQPDRQGHYSLVRPSLS